MPDSTDRRSDTQVHAGLLSVDHTTSSLPWFYIAQAAAAPCFTGLALGIGYANIGGVIQSHFFKEVYGHPPDSTLQALAGAMQAGCIVGALGAGSLADSYGRLSASLVASVMLNLGCACCCVPLVTSTVTPLGVLFMGRALIGLGGGMLCTTVPMYVSEVAPSAYRGAIESTFQLAVEAGILLGYCVNYAFVPSDSDGWKISLGVQLLPSLLLPPLFAWALPPSPHWLVCFRPEEPAAAEKALRRCRPPMAVASMDHHPDELSGGGGGRGDSADDELQALQRLAATSAAHRQATGSGWRAWAALWAPEQRQRVLVSILVIMLQVATGIDIVTVYAPQIFSDVSGASDDDERTQLRYTIFVGIVFCAVTPFTVAYVDRIGRRPLLLAGSAGMAATMLGLSACGALSDVAEGAADALSISFVLLFVLFFSFSWGPVAWVVPSEMVGSDIRAKVLAAGTVLNWASDYAVVSSFLSLSNLVGSHGVFAFYGCLNVAALVFVYVYVPETKGTHLI